MTLLLISELAERSGVPVSTLRFYERIGLVQPSGRAGNNYREYDEATVERLAFIARAKRLGMNLDDVATLTEAWFAGECEPMRDRLRGFVTGRIAELRRQIAEDWAFEGQLQRILARLSSPGPASRHCVPDCGCDTDPLEVIAVEPGAAAIGCSLAPGDLELRIGDWRRLLGAAARTERGDGTLRAVFAPTAGMITELVRLCEAEVACCPLFEFNVEITANSVVVTIAGSVDGEALFDAVFARPDAQSPGAAVGHREGLASRGPHGASGHIAVNASAASPADRRRRPPREAVAG